MKTDYKYVILGGGISALSFAQTIGKDADYLIVEKTDKLGGLCKTHYRGDYVWDYAGHFFHFADKNIQNFFYSQMAENSMVTCRKDTKIYYNGRYIDYPFQKNIHQLPQDEFIECLYDLYFRKQRDKYNDFEEMLYGKFGKGITDKFLKPYNEKLYACSLHSLDVDAMGRFFPYADIKDIIGNMKNRNNESYNATFDYPRLGAQVFIDVLLSDTDTKKVLLNAEVTDIDTDGHFIKTNVNGESVNISYENLISTVPLSSFVSLSASIPNDAVLSYNQVLVFNIGFDSKLNEKETHWVYYPERDIVFYRVGFYDNILSSDKGSIYVEIGFAEDAVLDDKVIDDYYRKTLKNLRDVGLVNSQGVVDYESIVISPGYVHITPQSITYVENLKRYLRKRDIYLVGRYAEWTYCSMEDCIKSAQAVVAELRRKV